MFLEQYHIQGFSSSTVYLGVRLSDNKVVIIKNPLFLTKTKMEIALKMLQNPNVKVYEVSKKLGFG